MSEALVTGRCYCGSVRVQASALPLAVTYCHCEDCRRLTGAPVAAFVAVIPETITFNPPLGPGQNFNDIVTRWRCPDCGSQLAASYIYLPDQLYLPLGLIDQAADLVPQGHSHAANALPWLHITDGLPRDKASGRDRLKR